MPLFFSSRRMARRTALFSAPRHLHYTHVFPSNNYTGRHQMMKRLSLYLIIVAALFVGYGGYKVKNRIENRLPPEWSQSRDEIAPPAGLTWNRCAAEGERCSFDGTMRVRYAADGTAAYRTATSFIDCSAGVFGMKAGATGARCEYTRVTADAPPLPPVDETAPVTIENSKPGTTAWQLQNPAVAGEIEGYASLTSVAPGGRIGFHVHTEAASYNIDVYRMGYYGGRGGRLMASVANLPGRKQPKPCAGSDGLIECDWSVGHTLDIPAAGASWPSGIYLAKLTANGAARKDSYIIFVVRDDSRAARYVAQLPDSTYQAYNLWGGKSLYSGCANHDKAWQCPDGATPPNAVSFNRPYGPSTNPAAAYGVGAGEFLTNVQPVPQGYPISSAGFDYNMVRWMERRGYDVEYISNLDLHARPEVLEGARAFVSMGHDEYYSRMMRDRLVAARDKGLNLAFFSSNQVYWQVRFADAGSGEQRQDRTMICYKRGGDPVTDPMLTTGTFRSLQQDEAAFMGSQYVFDPAMGDIAITNPGHWLFHGSGANASTVLRGLLGYEINAVIPGISPANVVTLSRTRYGRHASDMTYYLAASGAQVFGTGSMQWSWGLDDYISNGVRPDYRSPVAQHITDNVFRALGEQDLYTLQSADGALLAGAAAGGAPVQPVSLAQDAGLKATQWRLLEAGDGRLRVVSRNTGRCLDAFGGGEDAPALLRECDGMRDQLWRLQDQGGGMFALRSGSGNRCLTARAGGNGLALQACDGSAGQRWKSLPLEAGAGRAAVAA